MNVKEKIINYFFHHDIMGKDRDKVWKRLLSNDKDTYNACKDIWNKVGENEIGQEKKDKSYHNVSDKLYLSRLAIGHYRTLFKQIIKYAAIWIIPILVFAYAYNKIQQTKEIQDQVANVKINEHTTGNGEIRDFYLPEGTHVWLNAGSILLYPSQFIDNKREVFLSGEAFFQVKHNHKRPFIVHTNHLVLTDVGTSFNITSYPDENHVTVTLQSGEAKVKVHGIKNDFLLNPDEQLVYTSHNSSVNLKKVRSSDYSKWLTYKLYFNDISLQEVANRLERAYGVHIYILTPKFARQHIRAHFNSHEKLENILHVIADLIPGIHYEIEGGRIFIR